MFRLARQVLGRSTKFSGGYRRKRSRSFCLVLAVADADGYDQSDGIPQM